MAEGNLTEIAELASTAAREAGDLLMSHFGAADIHEKSSTQNLVTEADLASESLLRERILAAFPAHTILGEESEFTGELTADHLWVVDPLDGTNNFAHGIPHFCVSVAYFRRGQPQIGVVHDPVRSEEFRAIHGQGATLNQQTIHVSRPDSLSRSVIATGFYYDRGVLMETTLKSIERLFHHNIRGMRRMGAAALDLSWIACGRFQGFFEYQLAPWDYAAGALLVEEAGGIVRDRAGNSWQLDSQSVIAACAVIADELTELVRFDAPRQA